MNFESLGSTDKKLYYRISYSEIRFNSDIRKEVCDTIIKMMSKEASNRPSAKKVNPLYLF